MSTNAIEKNEPPHSLSNEREYLERELGTADARELVLMIRSLEAQLVDLYQAKEEEEKK